MRFPHIALGNEETNQGIVQLELKPKAKFVILDIEH